MKRILLVLTIAVLGFFYSVYKNPRVFLEIKEVLSRIQEDYHSQQTTISLTYLLRNNEWTEFPLPVAANKVKVLTNYIPPPTSKAEGDKESFAYSFDYQLLNGDTQTILKEGTYHFISKLTLYKDAANGQPVPGIFLNNSARQPIDGRIMQIDLTSLNLPQSIDNKRIRFKNGHLNPTGADTLIRIFVRQKVSEIKQTSLWSRLHTFQKEQLAKGNTFSQDLLTDAEIRLLMNYQWIPIGPAGIPDRNFTINRLYIRREVSDSIFPEVVEPTGFSAEENRPFTYAVPEEGKKIRFIFKAQHKESQESQQSIPQQITVRWFGKLVHENMSWSIPYDRDAKIFENHFEGGIIEVESNFPVQSNVFDVEAANQEIQPEPLFVKMFISKPDAWLSYAVRHLDTQPTPIRIAVRAVAPPLGTGSHVLKYRTTDKNNAVVQENYLEFTHEKSRYDQMTDYSEEHINQELSEPAYFYLRLPPEVAGLDFQSEKQLLVTVANRPAAFLQPTLVPEDYFKSPTTTGSRPSWFIYPPLSYKGHEAAKEVTLIRLQHRPPIRQEDLLQGRFHWESFRPVGQWQGKYLFVPRVDTAPLRIEALAATFHIIPSEEKLQVKFGGPSGLESIKPDLIFFRKASTPFSFRIEIDGKVYFEQQLTGSRGVVSLPPLTIGPHTLKITGKHEDQFFISNLLEGADAHTLRFAYKLDKQPLSFTYTKKEAEELLSFFYYSPCGIKERTKITVTLVDLQQKNGIFSAITQSQRLYDVRSGDDPVLPLLYSASGCTDNGQRFFFPLGADLPPGTYRFKIETEKKSDGFILMYKVIPGQYSWSRFFLEEE